MLYFKFIGDKKCGKRILLVGIILIGVYCWSSFKPHPLLPPQLQAEQISSIKYIKIVMKPGVMGDCDITQGDILEKEEIYGVYQQLADIRIYKSFVPFYAQEENYPFIWLAIFCEDDNREPAFSCRVEESGKLFLGGNIAQEGPVFQVKEWKQSEYTSFYEGLDRFIVSHSNLVEENAV